MQRLILGLQVGLQGLLSCCVPSSFVINTGNQCCVRPGVGPLQSWASVHMPLVHHCDSSGQPEMALPSFGGAAA